MAKKIFNTKYVTTIVIILFVVSMLLPAVYIRDYDGYRSMYGYELALFGAIAFLGGGILEFVIWLSNLLFIFSIFLGFDKSRSALFPGFSAIALSLSFSLWKTVLVSENGREAEVLSLSSGYYLWISSIILWNIFLLYRKDDLSSER